MTAFIKKIGIVSHILPPSPSGQAMVLYRLLNELPSDRYCLMSRENYNEREEDIHGFQRLSARYYHLRPVFQLPVLNESILFAFNICLNALPGIYSRANQIKKIIQQEECQLLIACTGDFYDLPAAYLASKWTAIPLITYLFDDYAYQWFGFKRLISRRLEPIILQHAKAVIVTNEHMQKEYERRYGVHSNVIHNPCPLPRLDELDKAGRLFSRGEINIVYTGAVYHAHYNAFRNLVTAIQLTGRSDIKLHIYTDQPESVLERNGIVGNMVVYYPHIKQSKVPVVLRQADILFLPLAFDSPIPEVIKTSAPGKTGEYLSVGRPILVHAPQGSFISWYFKENNCGVVVDNNEPEVLFITLKKLIDNKEFQEQLNKNARKAAGKDFSIDKMKSKFMEVLEFSKK